MGQVNLSASLLLAGFIAGQHPHMPGPAALPNAEDAHHVFLEQERAAIGRGEGFGMAMPADLAGYPGPKHVLEMKEQLKLTADQVAAMEKLFAEMKKKALERGREVLLAEERLGSYFAEGRSEAELREETYRTATLRAELRWVHLSAHLAARRLLTPEQITEYQRLRHSANPRKQMH